MTDELRKAAERLRRYESARGCRGSPRWFDAVGEIYPGGPSEAIRDRATLARAYLAEHAADDGEPVTEEWLREVGFSGYEYRIATGRAEDAGPHLCFGFNPIPDDETPRAWLQYRHLLPRGMQELANVPIPMPPTRGHVRALLKALGIPAAARPGDDATEG